MRVHVHVHVWFVECFSSVNTRVALGETSSLVGLPARRVLASSPSYCEPWRVCVFVCVCLTGNGSSRAACSFTLSVIASAVTIRIETLSLVYFVACYLRRQVTVCIVLIVLLSPCVSFLDFLFSPLPAHAW